MVLSSEINDSRVVDLMQRVKHLDAEAWADLVRIGSPWIYRWCRRAGVEPREAGEIVERVFAGVSRAIGNFRREITVQGVRQWWWSVTRNKIKGYYQLHCDEATAEQRINALPDSPPADEAGSPATDVPADALSRSAVEEDYLREPAFESALARILAIGRDTITSRHPQKRGK
jgi:DNA-directed RNA polymerase specialized sigma24 family protein